jgi:ribonuclease III
VSSDRAFARQLYHVLGFVPKNVSLYKMAFQHKGGPVINDKQQNNERLEYLGDAVLGTIVAEYLYTKYPLEDEGYLTKMRSKIVKRDSLNEIAREMNLEMLIAKFNGVHVSRTMLGNCLEALVGAIYLERGYRRTETFVARRILLRHVDMRTLESFDDNYKSQLLEWSQKQGRVVAFKLVTKFRVEKRDRYKISVTLDGKQVATADDFNKKSAEQLAAKKALIELGLMDKEA